MEKGALMVCFDHDAARPGEWGMGIPIDLCYEMWRGTLAISHCDLPLWKQDPFIHGISRGPTCRIPVEVPNFAQQPEPCRLEKVNVAENPRWTNECLPKGYGMGKDGRASAIGRQVPHSQPLCSAIMLRRHPGMQTLKQRTHGHRLGGRGGREREEEREMNSESPPTPNTNVSSVSSV